MRTTSIIDALLSVIVLVVVLLTAACSAAAPENNVSPSVEPASTPTDAASSPTVPRLRIKNAGKHDLKNLVVMFPESRIEFGIVPAGSTSEYRDAPKGVYNYGAYEYEASGETAMQPVMDWIGESPRPGQSYTYVLDYDPNREGMKIELLEVQADTN